MKLEDHGELIDRMAAKYVRPISAWAALEEEAFGAAMGSNGYTIREEAEALLALVDARPPGRLLDLGTGRGWPGRLIARESHHSVVAMDVPIEALRLARDAFEVGLAAASTHVCAGDGSALPFMRGSFDAVTHADVFC